MTNTTDVNVTIGGEPIAVPPMSFAALKRAWPAIIGLADKPHVVAQAEAAVEIVAAALQHVRPDLTALEIEARLIGREFLDLLGRVPHLLVASGLVPAESDTLLEKAGPGESGPGKTEPETANSTGTTASPNSSASASAVGTTSNAP